MTSKLGHHLGIPNHNSSMLALIRYRRRLPSLAAAKPLFVIRKKARPVEQGPRRMGAIGADAFMSLDRLGGNAELRRCREKIEIAFFDAEIVNFFRLDFEWDR